MNIERDDKITWHDVGTLDSVTRWITSHDEGLAELLKNVRSQYQVGRADVPEELWVTLILLKDEDAAGPARIGVLALIGQ